MLRRSLWVGGIGLALGLCCAGYGADGAEPAEPPIPAGAAQLSRMDQLPRLRPAVKTGCVSSYDRSGGNDDGFSGKYSFVRKEGDALVIADLQGPGVVTRVWTPTPTDDPMEFYFDGESTPRVRTTFRKLFDGTQEPFRNPVAGFGAGGFWCYVPMPYRKSCKILVRGKLVQFYQVNWATYPAGYPLETFDPKSPALDSQLSRAARMLERPGQSLTDYTAPGQQVKHVSVSRKLEAHKAVTLWQAKRGGRILGLYLTPADALAGKARDISLRITWDGDKTPAVNCPVGDFFGASWGEPATRSLMFGTGAVSVFDPMTANRHEVTVITRENTDYVYFPMPFDRSAKVELVSDRDTPVDVTADIDYSDQARTPEEGRFYAIWRRENPTTIGEPFTYVKTEGRGHVVGVTLQAQGPDPGITPFFEGDDQVTIDGELSVHGTGSEDSFNGGWYDVPGRWEQRVSFPLSGCLDYKRPQARSGAYRLFVFDPLPYTKSIHFAIEHAPEKNNIKTDYVGMAYLYAENHPTGAGVLQPAAERIVNDPTRLVFTPGWYMPVHSFSVQNSTLARKDERVDNRNERILSFRGTGEDVFGPHHVSLLCDVPAAGRYRVTIDALEGPEAGIAQLFVQEHGIGNPVDLYAAQRRRRNAIPLGELDMKQGLNQVFIKVLGKNPKATSVGLDLVTITLDKTRAGGF